MEAPDWTCRAGSPLLVPSGPTGLHLFVIALGPDVLDGYGPAPQVLMASATTLRDGIPFDPACILEPGDPRSSNTVATLRTAMLGSTVLRTLSKW